MPRIDVQWKRNVPLGEHERPAFYILFPPLSSSASSLPLHNQGSLCPHSSCLITGSYYGMTSKMERHPVSALPSSLEGVLKLECCLPQALPKDQKKKKSHYWRWVLKGKDDMSPNLWVPSFLVRSDTHLLGVRGSQKTSWGVHIPPTGKSSQERGRGEGLSMWQAP